MHCKITTLIFTSNTRTFLPLTCLLFLKYDVFFDNITSIVIRDNFVVVWYCFWRVNWVVEIKRVFKHCVQASGNSLNGCQTIYKVGQLLWAWFSCRENRPIKSLNRGTRPILSFAKEAQFSGRDGYRLEMTMGMGFPMGMGIPWEWELVTKVGMGMGRNGKRPVWEWEWPLFPWESIPIGVYSYSM